MSSLPDLPPIIAILRGVSPDEVVAVAGALIESGIRGIEVPLNSPDPLTSIRRLCEAHGRTALRCAGTVLDPTQVREVKAAGGALIVSPDANVDVIRSSAELGLISIPGFATATEAFAAIHAGASALKLFPASTYGPAHIKALRAVLPKSTRIYAVGGVGASTISPWAEAGIDGIGIGTELYAPGRSLPDLKKRAAAIVAAFEAVRA